MVIDNPPSDEEVLAHIRAHDGGVEAEVLINELRAHYDEQQIIEALQRVFERGKVDFSEDALLIPSREIARAA